MDEKIAVTAEEYSEVLFTWLRMYTNKDALKAMSKYIEYKMPIFDSDALKAMSKYIGHKIPFSDSDKKLKFLEELIFVYTALICYVSDINLIGNDARSSIRASFVEKVAKRYGENLSTDDPDFQSHFSDKLKEYSSAVSEGARQTEVSRIFIGSLSPRGGRNTLKSAALAAVSFGIFCSTLKETLAKHEIASAPN